MAAQRRTEPGRLLGRAQATARDWRLAGATVAALVAAFAATAPFASVPLGELPAFIPAYDTAVLVLSAITAVLLTTQYVELKDRSLLTLACGYAYLPPVIVGHALAFPDTWAPGQLVGGPQTTAWLWMAWHGVFPLFVCVYALRAGRERLQERPSLHGGPRTAAVAFAATLALGCAVVLLTMSPDAPLPSVMQGPYYASSATRWFPAASWAAYLLALGLLATRTRGRRVIDVWVGVTLVAGLIEVALGAVLIDGRYQVGFYVGRLYGLLAASLVLALLLRESFRLQAAMTRAWDALEASEEQFRRAMVDAPVPVIVLADDGQVLQVSHGWREAAGHAPSPGDGFDRQARRRLRRLFEGGLPSLEAEFDAEDGAGQVRRWCLTATCPGALRDGRRFAVGMAVDVTERRASEERLRRERLAALNLMEDALLARQESEAATAALQDAQRKLQELDRDGTEA
jgi:PAS domain-containing protein